jgi:hypothetical protein
VDYRPELWLADYQLACQLGGMDDDNLIIRNLPLFLSDAARAWLEHLPPTQISNWDDLVKAFAGNFQGTYVRPGNSWDLRSCRQQPGESLRDYIQRFLKQHTELPNITDSDVIGAFLVGTTCRDLVSKLGRKTPTRASELMDIATKFASGQEAVEANFRKETLMFAVVGFRGTYHAVLGRPCYAKFKAVPNYTYLKLKMSGPNGVITVGSTYRHAYECDVECVEYAEALAESEALIADLESLSKEAPDAKRHTSNFEPAEAVKSVPLDPSNDTSKQVRIGSELDPK